jgi:succinate dehydrogenase / fumarate reductase cytochrome b subunit
LRPSPGSEPRKKIARNSVVVSVTKDIVTVLVRLIRSSLGKKYLMAITGLGLFLFVIGHMLGNLQIFLGPEAINRYGHFLQTTPEILWPARVGLLAFVFIHIASGLALTFENRQARGQQYEIKRVVDATYASRTMIWSGCVIFAFVAFHLAHYTLLIIHPEYRNLLDAQGRHDIYRMMVLGFQNEAVSVFYVISIGLLCWHLSHGVGAMFQSLGLKNEVYTARIDGLSQIAAVIIFLGYVSIPISILAGVLK